MRWIKASEKMPAAGKKVQMKWVEGVMRWEGDIIKELAELKPEFYNTLLWADESTPVDEDGLWKEAKKLVHESSMHAYISDLALSALKSKYSITKKQ